MNTARLTATVAWFGSYWQVSIGGVMQIVKTNRDLAAVLSGKAVEVHEADPPAPKPPRETVEQYLARGGEITKFTFPKPTPLPPASPEPTRPAPSRITLESLGLVPRKTS